MKRSARRSLGAAGVACALVAVSLLAPSSGAAARATTAPSRVAPAVTIKVAAAGDIAHSGSPGIHQKQTAALITSTIHPDKVLELGDAQYERGEYTQFLHSYDPTWGAFKNITAPVLGNHEYETSGADGFFRYFADQLSGHGSTATDPHAGYYSFDLGDWHIVALNSNCHFASCTAQANWLRNDVNSDNHLCELVMFHNPRVGSFLSAAAGAKVDLALTGHLHRYERWDHIHGLNLRLFIVGTGGESSGPPDPHANAKFKGYGVLSLDLSSTGYSWQYLEVGNHVKDSGSASCHD